VSKRLGLCVVAALVTGCGGDGGAPGIETGPNIPAIPSGPTGAITLPIVANTALAKVVVRRNQFVDQPVFDEEGALIETRQVLAEVWKYVANLDPSVSTLKLPIGAAYTIEVLAGDGGTPRKVLAYYKSGLFDVIAGESVAPAFTLIANDPTFTIPSIYIGLGAPYDRYTVNVVGVQYPWATSGWSVTSNGVAPVSKSGTNVTFAAPAAAGDVSIAGKFLLDSSVLLAGESSAAWELTPEPASTTTVPFGDVTVIP
jgi:hypothetical protein